MIRERAKIQAQVDMLKTLRELSFSKLHCDSTHSTEPMCVSLSSNCLEQPRSFFHVSKGCCEAEGNTAAHLATGRNHIKVDLWLPKRACAPFWVPTLAPGNGKTWQDRTVGFGFPVFWMGLYLWHHVAPAKTDFARRRFFC